MKIKIDRYSICIIVDKDRNKSLGSGFVFIKPKWVVTAKHVVIDRDGISRNILVAFLEEKPIPAKILFVHPIYDLAVLEIETEFCRRPLFPAYDELTGENGLFYCGYSPSNSSSGELTTLVNYIESYKYEIRSRDHEDEKLIIFDAPIAEGGHSGGSVLSEGGGVVAVIIEGFPNNEQFTIKATSILPLLQNLIFKRKKGKRALL